MPKIRMLILFILSVLVGAFAPEIGLEPFSGTEAMYTNTSDSTVNNETKFSTPELKYRPRWWPSESDTSINLMRTNFCQKSRVTVASELSPYFEVCLNKDGFRDQNYSREKPANTLRVAALGDAVTFGLGVENNQTWPSHLEDSLDQKYEDRNIQTLNFGIPFVGTKEEVIWMNHTGRRYNPDLVVLQYMDNDAQNKTRVRQLETRFRQKIPDNISGKRRADIAKRRAIRYERNSRKNMSLTEEVKVVDKYLDKLEKYSYQDDFEVFIIYYTTQYTQRHLSYLKNVTAEKDWGFMVSNLDKNATYDVSFYLTPEGHRKTADQVAKNLSQKNFLESAD